MRLTSANVYAVRALVYLVWHGGEGPVPSRVIAEAEGMPEKLPLRGAETLLAAGVLHSARPRAGGYRLARPAKGISSLEVVEVVEGPVRGEAPPVGASAEGRRFDARLQAVCDKAAEAERRQLRRVSLADLAGKAK